jgi:sn-glycerol 3-phosphate transport system substrate-binding protein
MASGRAAMTFSYASALRSVLDAGKAVEGLEIGIGRLPGLPGDTGAPLLNNRGIWIIGLRPEKEQEAAWKFLKWLLEPEQQAEWSVGSGYLPANHAALDLPVVKDMIAKYPQFQVPLDLYLNSPMTTASLTALLGPFWQVREAVHQGEERMLSGAQGPDQALEGAAADANRIIEEYNQKMKD